VVVLVSVVDSVEVEGSAVTVKSRIAVLVVSAEAVKIVLSVEVTVVVCVEVTARGLISSVSRRDR
jgi:hypothetical protein